jgi:hypothetical protein
VLCKALPIFADDREGEIAQIFLVIFRTTR